MAFNIHLIINKTIELICNIIFSTNFPVGLLQQQLLYYDEYYYYLAEAVNMIY